jgi:hypothetical protein
MKSPELVRSVSAREYLDLFLVSAAASILLLRLGLHVSGYPSIGGGKYHVAHMLWGGLAMMLAMFINFAYLGRRVQRFVAILGGIGFGIFIDEVGKFITRDNNYFFRPSVGIIYAIFVSLYLLVSYLTRKQKLSSEEYQLNALRQLEEAVHNDMDVHERAAVRHLLLKADQSSEITQKLHTLLYELPVAPTASLGPVKRLRKRIGQKYEQLWEKRSTDRTIRIFFVLETIFFLGAVLTAVYFNIDDVRELASGHGTYERSLIMGQLVATVFASLCVIKGLFTLKNSRLRALEWFRWATLINLLLTEFFLFSRIQFGAMPSFLFNLVLFILLELVLSYERRGNRSNV